MRCSGPRFGTFFWRFESKWKISEINHLYFPKENFLKQDKRFEVDILYMKVTKTQANIIKIQYAVLRFLSFSNPVSKYPRKMCVNDCMNIE